MTSALHLSPGRIIGGRYTIQAELGRGSSCVTYRAITAPNREVALRVFDPHPPSNAAAVDALSRLYAGCDGDLTRFVAPLLEVGRDDESGASFLVFPLVATPSLGQLVELCPFEPGDAAAMVESLGRALDALHARGFAHLALKPTNVFVGPAPDRTVQLTDLAAPPQWMGSNERSAWLAPEQESGGRVGHATDVFTMALVAFHSLTGTSPSSTTTASARAREIGVQLPSSIDPIFARALAVDPAQRPRSAGALASELVAALDPARPRARPTPVGAAPPLPLPPPPPPLAAAPPPAPFAVGPAPMAATPEAPIPHEQMLGVAQDPFAAGAEAAALEAGPPPRRRGLVIGFAALLAALLGGGILLIVLALRGRPNATPSTTTASAAAPAVATKEPPAVATKEPPAASQPATAAAPTMAAADPTPAPVPTPTPAERPPEPAEASATPEPTASVALGSNEGQLTVICEPVACELVMIDAKAMPEYPNPVAIRAGNHGVGISKPGYGGQWQLVPVAAGERKVIRFRMTPRGAPPPKKPCGKFLERCD